MNNIYSYEDLTSFVFGEYTKIQNNFDIQLPPESFIKLSINNLSKIFKIYNKNLLKDMKDEDKFNRALNTMPHNWLWKLTHKKLWRKIKRYLEEQNTEEEIKEEKKEEINDIKPLFPEVIKPMSYIPTCEEAEE